MMVVVSVQHTGAAAVNDFSTFTLFDKVLRTVCIFLWGRWVWIFRDKKRGIVVFWVCCGKSPNKPLLKNRITFVNIGRISDKVSVIGNSWTTWTITCIFMHFMIKI